MVNNLSCSLYKPQSGVPRGPVLDSWKWIIFNAPYLEHFLSDRPQVLGVGDGMGEGVSCGCC